MSPFGSTGDRLWLRERFFPDAPIDGWPGDIQWNGCGRPISGVPDHYRKPAHCIFAASWTGVPLSWRSPIHMPRWASRLTLEISDVRVQRLQEISEEDAIAEGVDAISLAAVPRQGTRNRRDDFAQLWDKLNARRGYSWESNPWVWAITFRAVA